MKIRYFLFLGLLSLFSGCATLTQAYNPSTLDQRITSSQNQWRTTGSGFGLANRPQIAQASPELQSILDRLVYVSPLRGFPIKAYLVRDDVVNAESDGKSIIFHEGIIRQMRGDETQIAGVMGHELGHIIGNHVKNLITRETTTALLSAVSSSTGNENVGQLLQGVLNLGSAAYSRGEEEEADVIGAVLAHRAGYDSEGMIKFFEMAQAKKNEDFTKASKLLVPEVSKYNQAVRTYRMNRQVYNINGDMQAFDNADHWAARARQHADSIERILSQFQNYLNTENPLYMTHPPDAQRIKVISLVRDKELNHRSIEWLRQQNSKVAFIYETIEARLPKT